MVIKNPKQHRRKKIQYKIRKTLNGTADRPRLSIYKSNTAFYVQLIDDSKGHTLLAADTRKLNGKNKEKVTQLGKEFSTQLQKKGVEQILFDRSGYRYHGVVKAFSQALHESGFKH